MQESVAVTQVLEIPTWTPVYLEVSPEAATYTGAWTSRWLDFSTIEPMTAEELIASLAADRAIIEQHGVILTVYLWRYGAEEQSQRWLLDITVYPRPDVYPSEARTRPAIAWFWPFIGGLLTLPVINIIFGKGGEDGGDTLFGMIEVILPMMMMVMMMAMIMPMMTAMRD